MGSGNFECRVLSSGAPKASGGGRFDLTKSVSRCGDEERHLCRQVVAPVHREQRPRDAQRPRRTFIPFGVIGFAECLLNLMGARHRISSRSASVLMSRATSSTLWATSMTVPPR